MATHFARFHFHPIIVVCAAMLSWPVAAQGSGPLHMGSEVTASLGDQLSTSALAEPEYHKLKTDGVSATVTVLRTGRAYPAGGSAFAQIKLANTGPSKRVAAELVFEAESAVIRGVSGDSVKVREDGGRRIAMVDRIAKGKPRMVIVEVRLSDEESLNKLNVTLRQPGGTGETVTLGWSVTNCASGFYSQIVKVREGSGAGIAGALKAARSRDRARPGRWLFPPRLKSSKATRKCMRWAKRYSRKRGRYVYRCGKYETIEPVAASAAAPVKSERSIFNFASRYVSARAIDRELSLTRDSGWAANRVSQNLRGFLNQKRNPAICTGAIQFLDYFDKRLEGFAKRANSFEEMASKSRDLAQLRTSQAIDAAKVEPGGHPGWGSAPLDLPQATPGRTLKNQLETLAQLTNDAELGQRVSDAGNAFAALRAMSDHFNSEAAKSLTAATRTVMYRALSAIEAADYIGTVNRHYADLRHALMGSMSTIRQAHASTCTCGG